MSGASHLTWTSLRGSISASVTSTHRRPAQTLLQRLRPVHGLRHRRRAQNCSHLGLQLACDAEPVMILPLAP
jgi:hypothetical protein